MSEKKKEEKSPKGFLGNLFKAKKSCCCDVKFVPIEEEEQKESGHKKKE